VGSYGAPVLRRDGEPPLMLTAAHVVGSLSCAHPAQREVLLRSGPASASAADPRIGDVVDSHPPEPCEEVHLDGSLVRVDDHVKLGQVVCETITSGRARDLEGVEDLVTVFKRGINTPGLTEGLLDPTPASLKVLLPRAGGAPVVRDYLRGWFVYGHGAPFARPGDSGSIVVDGDDCVVAMVVALRTDPRREVRTEDPAFVIPILDILAGLGVRLSGPDRPCTLS
jgi:hypothetical protein